MAPELLSISVADTLQTIIVFLIVVFSILAIYRLNPATPCPHNRHPLVPYRNEHDNIPLQLAPTRPNNVSIQDIEPTPSNPQAQDLSRCITQLETTIASLSQNLNRSLTTPCPSYTHTPSPFPFLPGYNPNIQAFPSRGVQWDGTPVSSGGRVPKWADEKKHPGRDYSGDMRRYEDPLVRGDEEEKDRGDGPEGGDESPVWDGEDGQGGDAMSSSGSSSNPASEKDEQNAGSDGREDSSSKSGSTASSPGGQGGKKKGSDQGNA
jgi:hypothetical protein